MAAQQCRLESEHKPGLISYTLYPLANCPGYCVHRKKLTSPRYRFLTSLAPAPTKKFPMVLVTILAGRYVESSDFNYASLKNHFRTVNDERIRVIGEGETS